MRLILAGLLGFLVAVTAFAAPEDCVSSFAREGFSAELLRKVFSRLEKEHDQFHFQDKLLFVDYSKPSSAKRFFLMDLATCKFFSTHVTHARGFETKVAGKTVYAGDPDDDGMLDRCEYQGRVDRMSPHGFYVAKGLFSSQRNYLDERNSFSVRLEAFTQWKLGTFSEIGFTDWNGQKISVNGIYLFPLDGQKDNQAMLSESIEASTKFVRRFQGAGRSSRNISLGTDRLKNLENTLRISRGIMLYVHAPQCEPSAPGSQ